jgi:NAD(P)-dependent dehydrogenase (short-subunit alcohol dehydrogenase family)
VRSIALENKDLGITANVIVPAVIDTDAKRREIASMAICLVSDAAAEITGTSVIC